MHVYNYIYYIAVYNYSTFYTICMQVYILAIWAMYIIYNYYKYLQYYCQFEECCAV